MPAPYAGNILIQTNSGPLPLELGGTGSITRVSAINTLLPSQLGHAGSALNTDGVDVYWSPVVVPTTVTSVSGSGGSTGLTLTGGPITATGTLTLGGLLNPLNGGTGQTTLAAAINAMLPLQSGQSGKVLTTNGTTTSWQPGESNTISVKMFGAIGNGVADDSAAINNAIVSLNAAGGGVLLFPAGIYKHSLPITLLSNVLLIGYGATLLWSGGVASQITTPTTGIIFDAGIHGIEINGITTAARLLEIFSAYHCSFKDITFTSDNPTNVVLFLGVNTTGYKKDGNRNSVFNSFENIYQDGECGTYIKLQGYYTATPWESSFVTLNSFFNITSRSCSVFGIDFAQWCDSNYFSGVTRICLKLGSNSIGVVWNTASPTANVGVYANNFDHLAVDTFNTVPPTLPDNRIGIQFNYTKLNKIGYYFQDPEAGGGAFVATQYCTSYDVMHQIGGTNRNVHRVLGSVYQTGGAYNPGYSLYTSNYSLVGTTQGSITLSDTFGTDATNANGILVNNRLGAGVSLASYAGINILNPTLGVGASIGTAYGIIIHDLTSSGVVYGANSNISAGANRWNNYVVGSAANAYAGYSSFGKLTTPTTSVDATSIATSFVKNASSTYTVLPTDATILQNSSASVYTMPSAAFYPGRKLHILTHYAGAVTSAIANIVQKTGGAPTTDILPAVAGSYAILHSNGVHWYIIAQ